MSSNASASTAPFVAAFVPLTLLRAGVLLAAFVLAVGIGALLGGSEDGIGAGEEGPSTSMMLKRQ